MGYKRRRYKDEVMASRRLLVDTSILIDFLRKSKKEASALWKLADLGFVLYVSSVTVFEIYLGAKTLQHKQEAQKLLSMLRTIPFGKMESICASDVMLDLKKKNTMVEFRDVFIASTAIQNNLKICTLNFKRL